MTPRTPATFELGRTLERVAADYTERRYSGPGNPLGAQILRDGDLLATKVPFVPLNPLMNGVHGLTDPSALPRVLAHYASTNQPCWIDVAPYADVSLTDALCREGFRPARYASVMYATPVPEPAVYDADLVDVGAENLDVFLATMNTGFGMAADALQGVRRNQSFWSTVDTWHLLLARVDGKPAAAAVLSRHGNVGYLAAASTLWEFRNRGLHAALIAARLAVARRHGCDLVTVQAAAGSVSQCNQQRAGFVTSHTKTIWTNQAV
jgi:hypothetical protein